MEKSIQYLLPRLKEAMIMAQINPTLPVVIMGQWIDNPPQSFFGKKFVVTATQAEKTISVDLAQSGTYYLKKMIQELRSEGLTVSIK